LTEDEEGNWSVRYFDNVLTPEKEQEEGETKQITIAS